MDDSIIVMSSGLENEKDHYIIQMQFVEQQMHCGKPGVVDYTVYDENKEEYDGGQFDFDWEDYGGNVDITHVPLVLDVLEFALDERPNDFEIVPDTIFD